MSQAPFSLGRVVEDRYNFKLPHLPEESLPKGSSLIFFLSGGPNVRLFESAMGKLCVSWGSSHRARNGLVHILTLQWLSKAFITFFLLYWTKSRFRNEPLPYTTSVRCVLSSPKFKFSAKLRFTPRSRDKLLTLLTNESFRKFSILYSLAIWTN